MEKRITVRDVDWSEIFPWLLLARAFRLSVTLRVLVLASAGLIIAAAGCRLIGVVFNDPGEPQLTGWIAADSAWPWETDVHVATHWQRGSVAHWVSSNLPVVGKWVVDGPLYRAWRTLVRPFWNALDPAAGVIGLAYAIACCGWTVLVWSMFGGAIARIGSLALTRHESTSMIDALRHAREKIAAYFFAPFVPMFGVLLIQLVLALLGWTMQRDLGVLLAGIVWPLVLIASFLMAVLVLGLALGWPLMWPTVSTEGTDAFDALSRSYAYVFQRPLHYFFFVVIASALGLLGFIVVDAFAGAVMYLGEAGVSWGMDTHRAQRIFGHYPAFDRETEGGVFSFGAVLIQFWKGFVITLKSGFIIGFFWISSTAMYLLLRRSVDAVELDEVFLDEQGDAFGLPPLATDAAGVPGAAEDESTSSGSDVADMSPDDLKE